MKLIFSIALIATLAGSSLAQAECISTYNAVVDTLKKEMDLRSGDWSDGPFSSRSNPHAQMFNFFDIITSLGIPNASGTSKYSSASIAYNEAYAVFSVLKDAQIGGGINLINFVEDIRSEKKSLSSIDVETVASAIRDADAKNYFCTTHKMANYAQAKKVVINLVSP